MENNSKLLSSEINIYELVNTLREKVRYIALFVIVSVGGVATYLGIQKEVYNVSRILEVALYPVVHKGELVLVPIEDVRQSILAMEIESKYQMKINRISDRFIRVSTESTSENEASRTIEKTFTFLLNRHRNILKVMANNKDIDRAYKIIERDKIKRSVFKKKRKLITLRHIYQSYRENLYQGCSDNYMLLGKKCSGVTSQLYFKFLLLTKGINPNPLSFSSEEFLMMSEPVYFELRRKELLNIYSIFNKNFREPSYIGKQSVERKVSTRKKILIIITTFFASLFFSVYFLLLRLRIKEEKLRKKI